MTDNRISANRVRTINVKTRRLERAKRHAEKDGRIRAHQRTVKAARRDWEGERSDG